MHECAIEVREGRVWVKARISDHSAWGIFDTGSDGTALDSEFAQSIGLRSRGRQSASTVASEMEVEKGDRLEFDIGGAVLTSTDTNILPLSSELKGLGFILGFDALRSQPFTLCPKARKVVFEPFDEDGSTPFVLDGDIRPTVRMQVLAISSYAFLDTGSPGGVSLPRSWVEANTERLGITTEGTESKKILSGEFKSQKFTLSELTIEGSRLTDIPAEGVESGGGSFAQQSTLWGNIGNAIMQRFMSIAIDGNKRIILFGDLA